MWVLVVIITGNQYIYGGPFQVSLGVNFVRRDNFGQYLSSSIYVYWCTAYRCDLSEAISSL